MEKFIWDLSGEKPPYQNVATIVIWPLTQNIRHGSDLRYFLGIWFKEINSLLALTWGKFYTQLSRELNKWFRILKED